MKRVLLMLMTLWCSVGYAQTTVKMSDFPKLGAIDTGTYFVIVRNVGGTYTNYVYKSTGILFKKDSVYFVTPYALGYAQATKVSRSDSGVVYVTPTGLATARAFDVKYIDTPGKVATPASVNVAVATAQAFDVKYADTPSKVATPASVNVAVAAAQAFDVKYVDTPNKVATPASVNVALAAAQGLDVKYVDTPNKVATPASVNLAVATAQALNLKKTDTVVLVMTVAQANVLFNKYLKQGGDTRAVADSIGTNDNNGVVVLTRARGALAFSALGVANFFGDSTSNTTGEVAAYFGNSNGAAAQSATIAVGVGKGNIQALNVPFIRLGATNGVSSAGTFGYTSFRFNTNLLLGSQSVTTAGSNMRITTSAYNAGGSINNPTGLFSFLAVGLSQAATNGRIYRTTGSGTVVGYNTEFYVTDTGNANGPLYSYTDLGATIVSPAGVYAAFAATKNIGFGFYQNGTASNSYLGRSLFGSAVDNGVDQVQITGSINLGSAPAYSTGSYSTLVRNTTSGQVQSVPVVAGTANARSITATTATVGVDSVFYVNTATLATIPLPASAVINNYVSFVQLGAGNIKISQATGQKIINGSGSATTSGTGGFLQTAAQWTTVTMRYDGNNNWVITSLQGTPTYN